MPDRLTNIAGVLPGSKSTKSDRFIKQHVSQYGESILALGVRKDESIKRKTSIEKHQGSALEQNLSPSSSLLNCTIYTPIADWTTSQVWQYLLQIENPWGGSNQQLFQIYRGATNSSECPLVVEENTTSCGKSRFGCYVCTVASSEHSLTSMIENSAKNEWLEPLLELREILANSNNRDRHLRLTTKGVQFHFNKVNSQINLEPTPGKYHQNFRTALLTKLLETQKQIKTNAPKQYRDFELITLEELSQIRYLWLTYHHEIEDLLPKIYQSVMGKEYCELAPERLVNKLDDDFWQTAKEIADEPEAKLIASLLNVEAKHQAINQRQGIYQALTQQIKQQKMSQESEIYLGYKSKQAKNIDKAASTICEAVSFRIAFLKLTNRPIPKNKILKFQ
jgi:DNA sulfur modification protein DndC